MMTCKATQLALVSDNYIRRWRGCLSSPTTIFDDDPAAPILWQLYSTMTCKVTWIQWEQCKAAKNGNKKHNKCLSTYYETCSKEVFLQTFVPDVPEVAMICDSKSVSFCYAVYCSVYSAAKSFGFFLLLRTHHPCFHMNFLFKYRNTLNVLTKT